MVSKTVLFEVVAYCNCYTDENSNIDEPCSYAAECLYKAECDDIRFTYGCKPFDFAKRERTIINGKTT